MLKFSIAYYIQKMHHPMLILNPLQKSCKKIILQRMLLAIKD